MDDNSRIYFGSNTNLVSTNSEFVEPEADLEPSRTCPGSQQEWQRYWEFIGLELDSTVSVICQQRAEIRSVILRPRTTNIKNTSASTETARKYLPTIANNTVTKTNTNNNITQQTTGLYTKEVFNGLGLGGGCLIVVICFAFCIYQQCKSMRLNYGQDGQGDSREN